jgi:hypothetical protein
MPCAKENATAVVRNAPPTAISQPVRASREILGIA